MLYQFHACPARSLDLTAADCFLWPHSKSELYLNKPTTLDELKNSITEEEKTIDERLRGAVKNHVLENIEKCKV